MPAAEINTLFTLNKMSFCSQNECSTRAILTSTDFRTGLICRRRFPLIGGLRDAAVNAQRNDGGLLEYGRLRT